MSFLKLIVSLHSLILCDNCFYKKYNYLLKYEYLFIYHIDKSIVCILSVRLSIKIKITIDNNITK